MALKKNILVLFLIPLQGCAIADAVTAGATLGSAYFNWKISEKPPNVIYSSECSWAEKIRLLNKEIDFLSPESAEQIAEHNAKVELCPKP